MLSRLNPSNHPNCASAAIKARERVSLLTCANPYPKRRTHSTRLYFVRVASLEGRRRRGFRAHPLHSTPLHSREEYEHISRRLSWNNCNWPVAQFSLKCNYCLVSRSVSSHLSYSHIPISTLMFPSHLSYSHLISSFIFSSPLTMSLLTQAGPHAAAVKYGVHVRYEPRTSSNARKQRAREIRAQANHRCTEDGVSVCE